MNFVNSFISGMGIGAGAVAMIEIIRAVFHVGFCR